MTFDVMVMYNEPYIMNFKGQNHWHGRRPLGSNDVKKEILTFYVAFYIKTTFDVKVHL